MSLITTTGKIIPKSYEYHNIRILRFMCGCGKVHTFKKVTEKNEKGKVKR